MFLLSDTQISSIAVVSDYLSSCMVKIVCVCSFDSLTENNILLYYSVSLLSAVYSYFGTFPVQWKPLQWRFAFLPVNNIEAKVLPPMAGHVT